MFIHNNYAIGFVVSNEPLLASNAQDYRNYYFTVTNDTLHYLDLSKINRLIFFVWKNTHMDEL